MNPKLIGKAKRQAGKHYVWIESQQCKPVLETGLRLDRSRSLPDVASAKSLAGHRARIWRHRVVPPQRPSHATSVSFSATRPKLGVKLLDSASPRFGC
jgi:hypothetical protein